MQEVGRKLHVVIYRRPLISLLYAKIRCNHDRFNRNTFQIQICFAVGQEVVAEHGVPGVDETRRGDLAGSLPRQTQEHFPSSRRKLVKVYTFRNICWHMPIGCLRQVIFYLIKRSINKLTFVSKHVQLFKNHQFCIRKSIDSIACQLFDQNPNRLQIKHTKNHAVINPKSCLGGASQEFCDDRK